jgi:transposase-like protein
VLETSLSEEMTEHLGYEKHDPACAGGGNIRNGTRTKTVLTEHSGPVEIDVPRDRAATFEPQGRLGSGQARMTSHPRPSGWLRLPALSGSGIDSGDRGRS